MQYIKMIVAKRQVAMDTEFGGIYCAISDVIYFTYVLLILPQFWTNQNKTNSIWKNP